MKKCFGVLIFLMLSRGVFAADFSPTLLKLSAHEIIQYDFRGSTLEIPVTVEGTTAGLIFSVYTSNWNRGIQQHRSGYLGWHYVNDIDTCLYFSPVQETSPGETIITWDGRDQDGFILFPAQYTYYIWAFDNQGAKELVSEHVFAGERWDYTTSIQAIDESGLPLSHPLIYTPASRWAIGSDPLDKSLMLTTNIVLEDGWHYRGDPLLQQNDFMYQYLDVSDGNRGALQKVKFVSGGTAEIQFDWGDVAPYGTFHDSHNGASAGVTTDGTYLFTTEADTLGASGQSDFFIYDTDGYLVDSVDISHWWSSLDSESPAEIKAYGPLGMEILDERLFLFSHLSCLRMMIGPQCYLDNGNIDDLVVWENGNGDYTLDKNFEDTSLTPWVCNDSRRGALPYGAGIDKNGFVINSAYDVGAVSFGLLGPDGTGMGYLSFAGETAGNKTGQKIIDSDTPYDGLYCDNAQVMPPIYCTRDCDKYRDKRLYFLGHDSIRGLIYDFADCFADPGKTTLVSPEPGQQIVSGETVDIMWERSGTCPTAYVLTIEFSADNGQNWEQIATWVKNTDRLYRWQVPGIESESCLLRLMSSGGYAELDITDEPFSIVSDVATDDTAPTTFSLSRNYPNPFNPVTTIPFSLGKESSVRFGIYNTAGEKVTTLAEGIFRAGEHSVTWDASGFSSGVYFVRMQAGEFVETKKMTLVK